MSHQDLLEIFKKIENLLAPTDSTLSLEETPADWLDNILKDKLTNAGISVEDNHTRWTYVQSCLELLEKLRLTLDLLAYQVQEQTQNQESPTLSPDTLSVSQQQKVSAMLQLVIALGVVPYLLPGVGLSPEKRSKFLQYLLRSGQELTILERYNRLLHAAKCLGNLMSDKQLSQIIVTRHIGDILASYIQLSYAPLKKPSPKDDEDNGGDFMMTDELYSKFVSDQNYFDLQLKNLIDKIYPPLVVKYLLLLQSSGSGERSKPAPKTINKPRSPTPKWLQGACGKLLSERLVQKDGVLNVLRGVLDLGGDQSDPQKFHLIAQVISNPPSTGSYSDLESYYKLISPQIVKLLSMEDNTDSKTYHLIAAACARSLTERSLILTRRYLLSIVMQPLLQICEEVEEDCDYEKFTSEEVVEDCVRKLHFLFVIGNDPSLVFVGHLRPVILVLLELHCQITFGVSHLKQNVEQMVKAFLQKSCLSLSLRTLRAFAFMEIVPEDQLKPMNTSKFAFVPGENGGTKIIQKGLSNDGEESPSFYVADDEKSIAIVDLLLESKDKSLGVEFFLSLLSDLTDLMCSGSSLEISEQVSSVAGENPSEETCDRLLAIERDLDATMLRLRRQLMVIRLLGLLSEDEKLREAMMRFPDKLIQFLSQTLHRGALLCQLTKDPDDDSVFESTGLEVQSITTALSLLSYLVVEKNVRTTDWRALQGTLGDLGVLSEQHTDVHVRKMAEKLKQVIATHGAVLRETDALRSKADQIHLMNIEMQKKMDQMKILIAEESKSASKEEDAVVVESPSVDNDDDNPSYVVALQYLEDDEVPIKGHGLILLTQLVKNKDEETEKNMEKVFNIFQDNLTHEDTYIYLQSILGLAECANYNPDLVVDRLTSEFALLEDKKYDGEKGIEIRTKIGEALVRITRLLGEMTPAHKNKLLNPFLGQLGHPDSLVRASSLSNLGEVCKNLRFSIGGLASEIFDNLNRILQFDQSLEVRRAAVLVITLVLQGLGRDAFRVLESVLRDIWRTLISLRNKETDDVMLIHVGQAIEEVDKIVKQLFQPDRNMTKTIYVLDEPPTPF